MPFTFEMDIGKGVLAIDHDIYNFILADINRAVLICIAMQSCSHEKIGPLTHLIGKILVRCKYITIELKGVVMWMVVRGIVCLETYVKRAFRKKHALTIKNVRF